MKPPSYLILIFFILLTLVFTVVPVFPRHDARSAAPVLCREINHKLNLYKLYASDKEGKYLYLLGEDGNLTVRDLEADGAAVWTYETGGSTLSEIISDENYIYFTNTFEEPDGAHTLTVRALSKLTGIPVWHTEKFFLAPVNRFKASRRTFLFQRENDLLIVEAGGTVALLNKKDGSVRWKKLHSSPLSSTPVISGEVLIVSGDDRKLHFLDVNSGQTIKTKTLQMAAAILFADERRVIVGDDKGKVEFLDLQSGDLLWTFKAGAEISGVVETETGLLITSFDNFAYHLSLESGNLMWKKRFSSRLRARPLLDSAKSIAVLLDGQRVLFLDLKARGAVVAQIELGENESFDTSPVLINDLYIYNSGAKTSVYTLKKCPASV